MVVRLIPEAVEATPMPATSPCCSWRLALRLDRFARFPCLQPLTSALGEKPGEHDDDAHEREAVYQIFSNMEAR
jgi:hypothetical protein